jgi:hypothetical protein
MGSNLKTALLGTALVGSLSIAEPLAADWITIPATAFRPADVNGGGILSSDFFHQTSLGFVTTTSGSLAACLTAPVYLPHGAILQTMRSVLQDSDSDADVLVQLMRREASAGPPTPILVQHGSSGSSGVQTRTSPLSLEIDNLEHVYFLRTPGFCIESVLTGIYAIQFEVVFPDVFADGFESGDTTAWGAASP